MKKLNVFLSGSILLVGMGIASATTKDVPGGSITATSAGPGKVTITWSGFPVYKFVRYHLVESGDSGLWIAGEVVPGKTFTMSNVCANNEKFSHDARFQLLQPKDSQSSEGYWLAIWPTGVKKDVTLNGVHPELDTAGSNTYALEVDDSVLQQACGK